MNAKLALRVVYACLWSLACFLLISALVDLRPQIESRVEILIMAILIAVMVMGMAMAVWRLPAVFRGTSYGFLKAFACVPLVPFFVVCLGILADNLFFRAGSGYGGLPFSDAVVWAGMISPLGWLVLIGASLKPVTARVLLTASE